jgi:hypothetical protein
LAWVKASSTTSQWLRQCEEGLRDRSSRPRTCPHQTDAEVVSKIVYLRQHYHFGPAKIAMYLTRYHDVTISRTGCGAFSNGST